MDKILEVINSLQAAIVDVKTEAEEAQTKGKFTYNTSKNIRKGALDVARLAKDLRVVTLDEFKAQKGE